MIEISGLKDEKKEIKTGQKWGMTFLFSCNILSSSGENEVQINPRTKEHKIQRKAMKYFVY